MLEQGKDELRLHYLTRVLIEFMQITQAGDEEISYDGLVKNGFDLADEFANEVGLPNE